MDQPQSHPPSLPDQTKLQPEGVSNGAKRWIYLGIMGVVSLIVIANVVGSPSGSPPAVKSPAISLQQQNATAADIRSTEEVLARQQAALVSKTAGDMTRLRRVQQQAGQAGIDSTPNADMDEQLARLARLQDAQARAASAAPYGSYSSGSQSDNQKMQMHGEQSAQESKALFADNVVRQNAPPNTTGVSAMPGYPPSVYSAPESTVPRTGAVPVAAAKPEESQRKALDFDRNLKTYWLPEGTLLEAVLTNRLDGDGVGPVNCMTTTDVFLPGTRLVVIPQGSRVLGAASKVSATGQQRLAVAFHRIIVPGLHEYSIPLDGKPPALAQAGEAGLRDKANSHYASIFGASLAIGAIAGLAQIGNGQSGFGYDPAVQFRAGVSSGMTQTSERLLDRFLNRLPTITIREGTRTRILLTDDLQLPAYERTNQ